MSHTTTTTMIRPISPNHVFATFDCGEPGLNAWLQHRALANEQTGDSRTFVYLDAQNRVIAFYALTNGAVIRVGLTSSMRRNAPDPVGLLLLGQVGVDVQHQQQGVGKALMVDVFKRAKLIGQHTGFRALGTNPIDVPAQQFYTKFGFRLMPGISPALMLLRRRNIP